MRSQISRQLNKNRGTHGVSSLDVLSENPLPLWCSIGGGSMSQGGGYMQNWYLFGMTIFEMYYYFWFWSIFGWFLEVIVRTVETGGFENRGFMNGPYCPIYGVGVIGIVLLLTPIESNFTIFAISAIMCTIFELLVGLLLQALFHAKWWDYSDLKFNYKGYICLRNTLFWGISCLWVVRMAQPLLTKCVSYIPEMVGNIIAIILTAIFIYDLVESICEVRNLNNKLRELDALAKIIHDKSVALGMKISDEVLVQKNRYDKINEKITDGVQNGVQTGKEKYEKVSDEVAMARLKYELILEQAKKNTRLLRAFPRMKSTKYNNALKILKEKLNLRK